MDVKTLIDGLQPTYNWLLLEKKKVTLSMGSIVLPDQQSAAEIAVFQVLKIGPGSSDTDAEESCCEVGDYVAVTPGAQQSLSPDHFICSWIHVWAKFDPAIMKGAGGKVISLH